MKRELLRLAFTATANGEEGPCRLSPALTEEELNKWAGVHVPMGTWRYKSGTWAIVRQGVTVCPCCRAPIHGHALVQPDLVAPVEPEFERPERPARTNAEALASSRRSLRAAKAQTTDRNLNLRYA